MLTLLRHLVAILFLPFMVVVIVPYWLLTALAASDSRWTNGSTLMWAALVVGTLCALAGFLLFGWCVILFFKVGKGTLAPWDPTTKLVAVGPYRYVRNPMISGVALMLIGQALFFGSALVGGWAIFFITLNHFYFVLSEEPGLQARFGASYIRYQANVPRWLPRLTPWSGQ